METMKLEELDADLQEAVTYLTNNPEKIFDAWNSPPQYDGGILFLRVYS